VVSPSQKRRAIQLIVEENMGTTAEACRALGLARSSFYLASQLSAESKTIQREIKALSEKHPRYGYRRITALLRREGQEVNAKRVQRVRRMEGLQVEQKAAADAPFGRVHGRAPACAALRPCVELGLRGGPDRAGHTLFGC
jgi:putative transposase